MRKRTKTTPSSLRAVRAENILRSQYPNIPLILLPPNSVRLNLRSNGTGIVTYNLMLSNQYEYSYSDVIQFGNENVIFFSAIPDIVPYKPVKRLAVPDGLIPGLDFGDVLKFTMPPSWDAPVVYTVCRGLYNKKENKYIPNAPLNIFNTYWSIERVPGNEQQL